MRNLALGIFVVAGLAVAQVQPASACGGFFCSQIAVDQSAERIIFALSPNKVTAYIQINYQGDAKKFSWIVPVQAQPTITLGSQSTFTIIDQLTRPQFNLDYTGMGNNSCLARAEDRGGVVSTKIPSSAVEVLDTKQVGPFDTVTLKSKSAEELVAWLATNGYDQPPTSTPLIDYYVKKGMLFVAVKLTKSASVGEIAPLVLEMDTGEACVPLILTQIAAVPNMPVIVYVLGSARAFPRNWFHVDMDFAQINWLQNGSNYVQMATAAIDEAAGHGFVTEYAGPSAIAKGLIYAPGRLSTAGLVGVTDPSDVLQRLIAAQFPRDATLLAILREFIPLPAALAAQGVDERSFYNNIAQYEPQLNGFMVNSVAFVKALEDRVVTPLKEAQALFDQHPYLTRLMSTVSPSEMNRDPLFLLNPDLPNVSNVHTAKVSGMCSSNNSGQIKDLTLTLEDGQVLALGDTNVYNAGPWKFETKIPRAKSIQLVGTTGQAVRLKRAEVKRIDEELNIDLPEVVRGRILAAGANVQPGADGGADEVDSGAAGVGDGGAGVVGGGGTSIAGCSCNVTKAAAGSPLAVLGLLGLALHRVARRRPRNRRR